MRIGEFENSIELLLSGEDREGCVWIQTYLINNKNYDDTWTVGDNIGEHNGVVGVSADVEDF